MRKVLKVATLVLVMSLGALAQSSGAKPVDVPPQPATVDPEYTIGAQDMLSISVWKEPDLSSNSVLVRGDGKVSLPLLNDVQAAGMTPMQLTADITKRLKQYIEDPRVTIIVTQMNSQRVYVLGQVGHPGPLPMLPEMTVLQALSSAGGLGQFANGKKIYVLRSEKGQQLRFPFNYNEAVKGKGPSPLILKPGDTVVVP